MPAVDFNQLMFHVGAGYMYQTRQAAIGNSALEICLLVMCGVSAVLTDLFWIKNMVLL